MKSNTLKLQINPSDYLQDQYNNELLDSAIAPLYNFTTATLAGSGTATVSLTSIKATDTVMYWRSTLGGTPGHLSYAITAGTGVVFTSSSSTDTSTIVYTVIHTVANLAEAAVVVDYSADTQTSPAQITSY